ncbi:DUF1294 domain-containing protein [Lacisediminihabitans sp. H27-G8]|uniref:DUF1294 domain-containing protein n=1 Tax=Lacisediminihabitans sp. H27-G8 TaxID=3111909 RepID=UPI0038FC5682
MADGDGGTRVTGTLTSWNDDRGFGFLTTDVGDRRVFVHISAFPRSAVRPLLGEALSFEIETAADGRSVARRVTGERMAQSATPAPEPSAPPRRTMVQRILAGRRPASFDYVAIVGFFLVYVFVSVQWPMPPWVLGVYLLTSILSFIVYAVDKRAATSGGWRISESSLLALGIIGGWPGAIVGQQVFRHKTRKRGFRSAFWGTVVLNVLAFVTFSVVLSERLQSTF